MATTMTLTTLPTFSNVASTQNFQKICLNLVLSAAVLASCAHVNAVEQASSTTVYSDQIVVPEVTRREVKLPRFPSNDFDVGLYGGTFSTQNFGTSAVGGLRLGYHITEDFFTTGFGQGIFLQLQMLVECRNSSITKIHNPNLLFLNSIKLFVMEIILKVRNKQHFQDIDCGISFDTTKW